MERQQKSSLRNNRIQEHLVQDLPDFFSGEGGVVPNLLGEFDTLPLLQDPGLAVALGGVPILNWTGGEISAKLIFVSEPWRDRLLSLLSVSW